MKLIRVRFDSQIRLLRNNGGIARYFQSLEAHVANLEDIEVQRSGEYFARDNALIHQTFYIPFFPSRFRRAPKVVTVFDFIPEKGSGFRARRAHMSKHSYMSKADGVIFISETVRQEAFDLGFRPPVFEVTPLASRIQADSIPDFSERKNFLLFIGNRSGYKNFNILPVALSLLRAEYELVIVGGPRLSLREKVLLDKLGIKYRHVRRPDDEALKSLYGAAKVCLIPSREEGFGLPMVEAMSMGCPVVCLDTAISREVGGDAVSRISNESGQAWAHAIDSLLLDPSIWRIQSGAGLLRARVFSWGQVAEKTAHFYRRVMTRYWGGQA